MSGNLSQDTEKTTEDPIDGADLSIEISNSDLAKTVVASSSKLEEEPSGNDEFVQVSDPMVCEGLGEACSDNTLKVCESGQTDSPEDPIPMSMKDTFDGNDTVKLRESLDTSDVWKTTYDIQEESVSKPPLHEESDCFYRTCVQFPQWETGESSKQATGFNQSKIRPRVESGSCPVATAEAQTKPDDNVDKKGAEYCSPDILKSTGVRQSTPYPGYKERSPATPTDESQKDDSGDSSQTFSLISIPEEYWTKPITRRYEGIPPRDKPLRFVEPGYFKLRRQLLPDLDKARSEPPSPPNFGVSMIQGPSYSRKRIPFSTSTPKAKKGKEDPEKIKDPDVEDLSDADDLSETLPSDIEDSKNDETIPDQNADHGDMKPSNL